MEIRDWSLITGRVGGYKTGVGGGAHEVLPLRKGGAENVLAMLKGGHKKFYPVLRGGGGDGAKSFGPTNFPFCSPPPPLPVINDQSLRLRELKHILYARFLTAFHGLKNVNCIE